jgi:hypothetical protein
MQKRFSKVSSGLTTLDCQFRRIMPLQSICKVPPVHAWSLAREIWHCGELLQVHLSHGFWWSSLEYQRSRKIRLSLLWWGCPITLGNFLPFTFSFPVSRFFDHDGHNSSISAQLVGANILPLLLLGGYPFGRPAALGRSGGHEVRLPHLRSHNHLREGGTWSSFCSVLAVGAVRLETADDGESTALMSGMVVVSWANALWTLNCNACFDISIPQSFKCLCAMEIWLFFWSLFPVCFFFCDTNSDATFSIAALAAAYVIFSANYALRLEDGYGLSHG